MLTPFFGLCDLLFILGTVVLIAAYLLNKRLTKILLEGFPSKEAWSTGKASVSPLIVFVSTCYRLVLDQLRKKFDDKDK